MISKSNKVHLILDPKDRCLKTEDGRIVANVTSINHRLEAHAAQQTKIIIMNIEVREVPPYEDVLDPRVVADTVTSLQAIEEDLAD